MQPIPRFSLPVDVHSIKGFLHPDEGHALYQTAYQVAHLGPCLEIGSYCGKSTAYLGRACQLQKTILFAVDHHRGSEEHQLGEEYHDPELYDAHHQAMDSFRAFRGTLMRCQLEDSIIPIVANSQMTARFWHTPLSMVFIDGSHSLDSALTDYRGFASHIVPGGILAIHDLFPDPNEGGQAPITIYSLAKASGLFVELQGVRTLGLLKKIAP